MSTPKRLRLPALNYTTPVLNSSPSIASSIREDFIRSKKTILQEILANSEDDAKGGSMEEYKGPIGVPAKLDFIDSFRQKREYLDRNSHNNLEKSPTLAYLEQVDKSKLSPRSMGIVFRKGHSKSFDLTYMSIGDNYAPALSQGLNRIKRIQELKMASNRLTEKGVFAILSNTDFSSLMMLNLAENKLGHKSVDLISNKLEEKESLIHTLILENTHLSEISVIRITRALQNNSKVTYISMAKNKIGHVASIGLGELLKWNRSIRKLDLHFNNMREEGAAHFFEGLAENETLKELDLSWNSLGNSKSLDFLLDSMKEFFKTNEALRHLDLSFNYFTHQECQRISESANYNNTILGLHIVGNHAHLDPKGFVVPAKHVTKIKSRFTRILEDLPFNQKREKINCWVCEHWIEQRFEWVPGKSGEEFNGPIYIHFDFLNFKREELNQTEDGIFYIEIAVPSHKIRFFYSTENSYMFSSEYTIKKYPPEKFSVLVSKNGTEKLLGKFNYIPIPIGPSCSIDESFPVVRPRELGQKKRAVQLVKIPWEFRKSIFRNYRVDSEELLDACFEADLKDMKLDRLIKSSGDLLAVVGVLKKNYKYLRDWYKNLASYTTYKIASIGYSAFKDFLQKTELYVEQTLKLSLGMHWSAVNVPKDKGFQLNPSATLVRYEFMEMLVRVAIAKYVNSKVCKNVHEAVALVIESIKPFMEENSGEKWRRELYICEQIDYVLKAHKPILDSVFEKYMGNKAGKNIMEIENFRNVMVDAGIYNDCFGVRETDVCFHQAKMTEVDELHSTKQFEMNFVEFIEAISRAAYKANLVVDHKNPKHKEHELEISFSSQLEALMPYLFKLCPKQVKDTFRFPTSETYTKMMYVLV